MTESLECASPESTFELGERIGSGLSAGDIVLLKGGLGAGKTLLTKGIVNSLGYDIDEVTSPSFTLVNLYKTDRSDVYHIDLWRLDESHDLITAVGLDEILELPNAITIIEWAEKLGDVSFPNRTISVEINGDGEDVRQIAIGSGEKKLTSI